MTENIPETTSLFSYFERNPLNPLVVEGQKSFQALGFEKVESDEAQKLLQKFQDFFSQNVLFKKDPEALFGKLIEDPSRSEIKPPKMDVLKKGKDYFLSFVWKNIVIITEPQPVKTYMGWDLRVEGLSVKHMLLKGNEDKWLDLISLRPKEPIRYLITFAQAGSGYSPARVYTMKGKPISPEYPSDVLLSLETNMKDFPYLFLHENTHARLAHHQTGIPSIRKERDANALAIQTARLINRLYPKSDFIDMNKLTQWAETQLKEGYDPKVEELFPYVNRENFASTRLRAAFRSGKFKRKEDENFNF